jgi:hypothetical protein
MSDFDCCAVTVYGPPDGADKLHDQYELTATVVHPFPPDPFTKTVTVAPVNAPPETIPGVTNEPGPSRVGGPSTLMVIGPVDVAPPTAWLAVSSIALPFGSESSLHDQLPGGFGLSVVGVVVVVTAVQLDPPGDADTTTVLPLSADPLTVTELLPKNVPVAGAVIATGFGVPAAGAGDTVLPFEPDGVAGSSADAGLAPKKPNESSAIAHTPVKTMTLMAATRRSSLAPRS